MFNNTKINVIGLSVLLGLSITNIILIIDSKRKTKKMMNQCIKTRQEVGNINSIINSLSEQKQEGS